MNRLDLRPLLAALAALSLTACGPEPIVAADFDPAAFGQAMGPGFVFGAATSSHQVEGGNTNDWSVWEAGTYDDGEPHIIDAAPSGLACDSWNQWDRDVEMLTELGANSYRMSLEWSRLQPTEGAWDAAAVARYRQMLIGIRAAGITPYVTVNHFTLPIWFSDKGGWEAETAIADFEGFTQRAAEAFGDLIDHWVTINEPNVFAFNAYLDGKWPPGVIDGARTVEVMAKLIEAHGAAAAMLRARDLDDADGDGKATVIGLAHHVRGMPAATPFFLDQAIAGSSDAFFNEAIVESVRSGHIFLEIPGQGTVDRPAPQLVDSFDFLGINFYSRDYYRADLGHPSLSARFVPEGERTDLDWDVDPLTFQHLLERYSDYGWPIYITENGLADHDDSHRADFLKRHLLALQRAKANGAQIDGYFHWSLMDNFEWSEGYHGSFGLYDVDFDDPARPRVARPSATLFREIADQIQ